WVRAGKSSSLRAFIFGSSSLIRATFGQAFLSSRSFFVPIIFFRVHSIISRRTFLVLPQSRKPKAHTAPRNASRPSTVPKAPTSSSPRAQGGRVPLVVPRGL